MTKELEALSLHEQLKGKVEVRSKEPVSPENLGLLYTPGVAEPCKKIDQAKNDVYRYTGKGNNVAVVSDGTAILGLGNIGPEAGLPVMEGKAILFKALAGVDAYPLCIKAKSVDEIVQFVAAAEPTFGAVNLEDIAAPNCFEVESRLKQILDIPVFHDDQHGTAIVVLAALTNALKLVKKDISAIQIVINGAGAAGIAIAKILLDAGAGDLVIADKQGILDPADPNLNKYMTEMAQKTNKTGKKGLLADALQGADVFIGVSAGNLVTPEMVRSMNKDQIIFAMANPIPEINPDLAKEAGAKIVASGSSNYPNQVNNLLAFPGVLRGALEVRAKDINEAMKQAAAKAIADIIESEIRTDYIIPKPFDLRVVPAVASAVAKAAIDSGIARVHTEPEKVYYNCQQWVKSYFSC